ncbi:hypothetical protein C9374_000346 [Naegleria lovaniensis]|uniref:Uncharacterized protein n=1 Tax=Naegleria lovaniensis TaxID=51637 RepID=A0AA88GXJ5_NAELO|nr:uncharacterized protein C9374_000346 [Naegleria lovaniensis]KAG2388907.1 hypothetical protein C9374_000346 [Naegleria lovaniensis]
MNFFYMDEMGNFTTFLAWDKFNVVKTVPFDSRYMFFGSYSDGYLLQYDSSKPWVNTELGKNSSNPLLLATATPHIIRPSCVLVHPNNDLVLMSGGPGYGKTGGGLLIWSRKKYQATILNHTQLIENHATHSMVLHPNMTDVLIAGTTIAPGSGGQQLATLAQLYMLNLTSNQIMWKMAPLPGVAYYYELIVAPQTGYVYGMTDNDIFFVFNPNTMQVIHNKTVAHACVSQGPHLFVPHVNGKEIYLTLSTGIFRIEPYNFTLTMVFTSKYAMCGGVIMKSGWFYFISNSHVYGFQLFNGTNVNPVPSLSVQPPKPSPIPSRSITPKASVSLWKPQISSSVWNPTNNRTAVSLGVSIFERNIVGFCGVIVVLILMLCNLSINI